MDPQAAWNEMLEAVATNDLFEAELRAEALITWLDQEALHLKPSQESCQMNGTD